MFVPRSLSKKKLAAKARPTAAASGGGSGQASLSPAPPAPTASGPSTPSSSSSTTAVPLAAPPAASSSSNSSALPAQPPTADPPAPASKAEAKAAAAARRRTARVARELALMLALVLSDHALSTDDSGLELGKWLSRLHYLPLSTLLKHPSFSPLPSPLPPPAALAKAIRQHAPSLSARLVLDEPRSFGGSRGQREGSGGLEVGRASGGWQAVAPATGDERRARMVYVEYLPTQLHTPLALLAFLTAVGPPSSTIVSLSDPPYRNCATVAFDSAAGAARFADVWSWTGAKDRARGKRPALTEDAREGADGAADGAADDDDEDEVEQAREAAVKAGLRALPKAEYVALEQEYLALLAARRPAPPAPPSRPPPPPALASAHAGRPAPFASSNNTPAHPAPPAAARAPPPAFPPGCLVFVRQLDPQTSKTALKDTVNALLLRGLAGSGAGAREDAQASYVDWVKGGDSAHIRFPHCSLSTALVASLSSSPTYHLPLLAPPPYLSPAPTSPAHRPLEGEVVGGERERLYWMAGGVKDAGRREAVRVALAWDAGGDGEGAKRKADDDGGGGAKPGKKRK